jgi:hypothetical protein
MFLGLERFINTRDSAASRHESEKIAAPTTSDTERPESAARNPF